MAEVSLKLFFSYSHKDEDLRDELAKHLTILERQGVISSWYDRRIVPGQEWDHQINDNLKTADIILLLVSSDFLASNYCWDVEVKTAIERHDAREACVIPVILRSVDWTDAPFAKLQALPKNAQPVKSWTNEDEAFTDVAKGIRHAANKLKGEREERQREQETERLKRQQEQEAERLRLKPEKEEALEIDDLSSDKGVNYKRLRDLLKAGKWKEANQETVKLMLNVAGREKEDYLDIDSINKFPCTDLHTIDQLWVKYSKGRYGFSVQKKIWLEVGKNWDAFCTLVDLDEAKDHRTSPEGHLPWFYHCVLVETFYNAFRLVLSRVETCKL